MTAKQQNPSDLKQVTNAILLDLKYQMKLGEGTRLEQDRINIAPDHSMATAFAESIGKLSVLPTTLESWTERSREKGGGLFSGE